MNIESSDTNEILASMHDNSVFNNLFNPGMLSQQFQFSYFYSHISLNKSFLEYFHMDITNSLIETMLDRGILQSLYDKEYYKIHPLYTYSLRQQLTEKKTQFDQTEKHNVYYLGLTKVIRQEHQNPDSRFWQKLKYERLNLYEILFSCMQHNQSIEDVLYLIRTAAIKYDSFERQVAFIHFIINRIKTRKDREKNFQSTFDFVALSTNLATLYRKEGQLLKAKKVLKENISIWEGIKSDEMDEGLYYVTKVTLMENASMTCRQLKNYDEAKVYLQNALELAKKYGNNELQANLHIEFGNLYKALLDLRSSKNYFLKAQVFADGLPSINAIIDFNLGAVSDDLKLWDESLSYYHKALNYFTSENDLEMQGYSFQNIGLVKYEQGDHKSAIKYFKKAIPIFITLKENYQEAQLYQNISLPCLDLLNFEESESYLIKALKLYKSLKETRLEAEVYQNLSEVYRRSGKYKKALDSCDRAIQLFTKYNDRPSLAKSFLNKGNVTMMINNYDLAEQYYMKAFQIFQTYSDSHSQATIYQNLADLERRRENYSKSKRYAIQALDLYCNFIDFLKIGWLIANANITAYQFGDKSILSEMNSILEEKFNQDEMQKILIHAKHYYQQFTNHS